MNRMDRKRRHIALMPTLLAFLISAALGVEVYSLPEILCLISEGSRRAFENAEGHFLGRMYMAYTWIHCLTLLGIINLILTAILLGAILQALPEETEDPQKR